MLADAAFFFTTPNCAAGSGPYFETGYLDGDAMAIELPPYLHSDGNILWGPVGQPSVIGYEGYRYPTTSSYCW
jgi:hypothetical protein